MIITVTLNPALDKTICVSRLTINGVNRVTSTRLDSGGKGINVSKVVHSLGGETVAMGILGGETGLYIQHHLDELKISSRFCHVTAPTRTNLKIIDTSLHSTTDINERGEEASTELLDEVFRNVCDQVKPGDMVVFAGANPPGTPDDLLAKWTKALNEMDVRVCLDTTGTPVKLAIEEKPYLIKPNKAELEDICGRRLYFDIDVISAAKELIDIGVERVAVSLGPEGALFVTEDRVIRAYAPNVPVHGQTGAGDSMMAALAYYLSQGMEWSEVIRHAMAISSAHVSHPGTENATKEEMEALLENVRIDELF